MASIAPEEWIDPSSGQPRAGAPLGVLLSAQAAATPDAPALTIGGETLDFATLEARANRRARQLAAHGTVTGDRVILSMANRAEYLEVAFALWKLGATPCPVSHRLAAAEFEAIVELCEPRLVVGSGPVGEPGVATLSPDEAPDPELSAAPLDAAIAVPGKIANSGGSTGRPKLIVDPLPSVWGPDKAAVRRTSRLTILNPGPLYHSAPFNMMTMALAQGCHVVCMERFDVGEWLALVERHRVEWAYLVPTMMSRISRDPASRAGEADLSSLATVLHMAAPCPPDVKRWWIDRVSPDAVWEVYGGTERVGVTIIGGRDWLAHPGSVGRASPGQEILVLGEDGQPLPPGEVGEVFFRKAGAQAAGYAYIGADSRRRGDADSFGDLGWLDEDGWLYIADRRTDMVLVGGVNVYPAEIEAALESLPGVVGAVVIGLPDADMGSALHAIVQLAEGAAPDKVALADELASRIAPLKRPRSYEFTTEPLRDDAGKVRRSALREARIKALPSSRGEPRPAIDR